MADIDVVALGDDLAAAGNVELWRDGCSSAAIRWLSPVSPAV
jgi:hypothetical protein